MDEMSRLPKHTNPLQGENSEIKPPIRINAIIIPEGATNGDMIKIMFPNAKITKQNEMMIVVDVEDNGLPHSFWKDWWDEPYKREVEEDV